MSGFDVLIGSPLPLSYADNGSSVLAHREGFQKKTRDMPVKRLLLCRSCGTASAWQPNRDNFGYCLYGDALVTVQSSKIGLESFVVAAGDMFFFPGARIDSIVNIGREPAEFAIALRNADEIAVGGRINGHEKCLSNNLLDVSRFLIPEIARELEPTLQFLSPEIVGVFPQLDDLAIFSLRMEAQTSMSREPEAELNVFGYVLAGRANVTIWGNGQRLEAFEVKAGDVFCAPAAMRQVVDVVGREQLHLLAVSDRSLLQPGMTRVISSTRGGTAAIEFVTRQASRFPSQNQSIARH